MANSLTALNPEVFSKTLMPILKKESVAMAIATTRFQSDLAVGDTFNRQYVTDGYVTDYTRYTDATIVDDTGTNEQGSVDQLKIFTFKIDAVDKKQNLPDFVAFKAKEGAYRLKDDIDQKFLQEVSNVTLDVDDGDIGGTASNPIELTVSNVYKTFTKVAADLGQNLVERDAPWYAVIDNQMAATLAEDAHAHGFRLADEALVNGYRGDFAGLKIYVSENLKSSVSLGLATNPTADDTAVINGVTFTFKAVPSVAGEVDIGANAAASVDNLVAAINGTGTPGATTYIELSTADRRKLQHARVTATDNTTSIGITAAGRMTLSETLTDATDGFGTQTLNCLYGKEGVIDMVIQQSPEIEARLEPKSRVTNYLATTIYGVKTFQEGKERSGNLKIKVS